MKQLKNVLIGVLIGIANIIPGVSGGTIALSLGVYEDIIHAINNILKDFKKSIKILLPIGAGIIVAILGLSKLINFCFERYEINTTVLFAGLILGALPALIKRIKGAKINIKNILGFLAGFGIILGLALISEPSEITVYPSENLIIILLIGCIASMTMVMPGISGSLILAILGFYRPIINSISNFIDNLLAFNIAGIWHDFFILTFFGLGVIIGIVVLAKLIDFLLNKFEILTFYTIIGIIAASPVALLVNLNFAGARFIDYVLMLTFASAGFYCAVLLGEK